MQTVKNPPSNAVDTGLIPQRGRSRRGGQGNPLQYSCLEIPMDSGAWWAIVHRVTKSRTRLKRLSTQAHTEGQEPLLLKRDKICLDHPKLYPFPLMCSVTQSCPTLWDPVDCSPPGSSVHGVLPAGILEWVATSFSNPFSLLCPSSTRMFSYWMDNEEKGIYSPETVSGWALS